MLISAGGLPDHALSQAHDFGVGLLGNAFHVRDVTEASREFEAHFSGGEVGNPLRHRLKFSRPLNVIAWGKHACSSVQFGIHQRPRLGKISSA
jgi:hypothetical protein